MRRTTTLILVFFLIAASTSPAFALGEGNRNYLLIGSMALSPFVIIRYLEFDIKDLLLLLFMCFITLFPLANHPETMRWSTVCYTCMFCLTFIAYRQLLRHSDFTIKDYCNLLRYLIYAYALVLLAQQFCVFFNLPIINISNYDLKHPWKLNSLTSEPSHSARFVALLTYGYIITREQIEGTSYNFKSGIKKDKYVLLAFVWTMTTMMSGTAFLFLAIVLSKFLTRKNLISLSAICIIILIIVNTLKIDAIDRTTKTVAATLTLNEATIVKTDHSASFRIVPFIRFAKELDVTSLNGLFGYGVDYVQNRYAQMFTGVAKGTQAAGGLMILAKDFGFIVFALFLYFSLSTCINKKDFQSYLFWLFMVLMTTINMQLLWGAVLILSTNKYFIQHKEKQ